MAAAVIGIAAPRSADALTINATYAAGVSAAQQAVINSAISFYQSTFSDPITVGIFFQGMTSGLGASTKWIYTVPYAQYRTALLADATSADDATANASLPAGPGNGLTASNNVIVSSALGRSVGLATPGAANPCAGSGVQDGCISINFGLTTTSPPAAGQYSLLSVVEHEIDEVLGLGSEVSGASGSPVNPEAEDLFRWASAGVRSFSANANVAGCDTGAGAPAAFFSIDGGVTNIDQFNNCNNGGDYGDWITHGTGQVQDAFGTAGQNAFLGSSSAETRALDVLGYTRSQVAPPPVPEPASLLLFGTGLVALARRRSRKHRN